MDLLDHYASGYEADRLRGGAGAIEYARTLRILERSLPDPTSIVLDVGGGPASYATWLLERGHTVHLIDPVPAHVDEARRLMTGAKQAWSANVGDARALPFESESADAVLLLGPLYHLIDRNDRLKALIEAWRALRPGGVLVCAAISRFASLFDGMARNLLDDDEFIPIAERDLHDGQHRNPTNNPDYFTTAYFHHPDELSAEVTDSGFALERLCGLEGPTWLLPDIDQRLANPARRALWFSLLERVESEPSLLGVSAHLIAIAHKPE